MKNNKDKIIILYFIKDKKSNPDYNIQYNAYFQYAPRTANF